MCRKVGYSDSSPFYVPTSTVRRLPVNVVDEYYAVRWASVGCFVGASAIRAMPMTMRTATPISSPREIMLRNAWVPITAA
jgi:hypothetical protein